MHFTNIELLLNEIQKKYRADINRICLIGISLGSYGSWNFAMQRANLFKSIVSIAGGAMLPKYASLIKYIPVYIAHGQADNQVNFNESITIANSLINAGGQVTLNIIPNI